MWSLSARSAPDSMRWLAPCVVADAGHKASVVADGFGDSRRTLPTVRTSRIGSEPSRLLAEIVRFLAVGGLATVVSVLGFNALVHGTLIGTAPLRQQPVPAYVLVNVVAGCVAYLGMWLWALATARSVTRSEAW